MDGEKIFRAAFSPTYSDLLGNEICGFHPAHPLAALEHQKPATDLLLPQIAVNLPDLTTPHALNPELFWPAIASTQSADLSANQQARTLVGLDRFATDPRFANLQGQSWTVAVIDTGINSQHSFFGADNNQNGIADRILDQYDFADGDASAKDINGHGSNTASIIGSQDANLPGVAPQVNIISLKVFNDSGESDYKYVCQALDWLTVNAARYRVASVLLALGDRQNLLSTDDRYQLGQSLATLTSQGVITVASAGNEYGYFNGQLGLTAPANDPHVIAVGAVYNANLGKQQYASAVAESTAIDRLTPFTQRQVHTLFAPGAPITGAGASGNDLLTLQGSSQAAAYVAGTAVLAQQLADRYLGRSISAAEFQELAWNTGRTIRDGDDEDDDVVNTGLDFKRLDVMALAESIWQMRTDTNQAQVSIAATQQLAQESGQQGLFTLTRTGNVSNSLTVNFQVAGSATNGSDYQLLAPTVTFAAGENTATIRIQPIDDQQTEAIEEVSVRLLSANQYQLANSYQAKLFIIDNDTQLTSPLSLAATNSRCRPTALPLPMMTSAASLSANSLVATLSPTVLQVLIGSAIQILVPPTDDLYLPILAAPEGQFL